MFADSPIPDLKRSIDAIGMAVFVVQVLPEGFAIAALNRHHERLTGLSHDLVSGRPLAQWLPPEITAAIQANYRRCLEAGAEIEYDEELELPGGRRWWHTVLAPLTDASGRIVRILGTATDITERKVAQAALRASEARLRAVLTATPDCVVMVDREGRLRYANAAVLSALELDPRGAQERTYRELGLDDQEMQPLVRDRRALFDDGRPRRGEILLSLPRGQQAFEYLISPVLDEQGRVEAAVMVLRDIGERKRVERLKDQFLATVSHELRTPLTSIRGSLGLLAGGKAGPLPGTAVPLVEIARKNCERLILLVNDILDMEKIQAGQMTLELQPQPLRQIVAEALESQTDYARPFQVSLELGAAVEARVNVDRHRLLQVLVNLLSNAAKFSPAGQEVLCTVSRDQGWIRVSVEDRGPGVAPAFHERIFQRFSQFDASDARVRGGTGLGLAISRSLIEAMGGRLDFDRQRQTGACFYFELPEWLPARADDGHDRSTLPRVLHVEDDPDLRQVVSTIARPLARFVSAATLAEARHWLAGADFDLVLLDLTLGDGSGGGLLDLIEQRPIPPPVVLFTVGPVDPELVRRAAAVLIKSRATDQQLLDTLAGLLATRLTGPPGPEWPHRTLALP